ncbi:insulinase family protein [Flammeovirga pectinis]|uniref:Insulinase family protein n=1 Tax=Flammeovirga pectinis TaxID=2494373 RepID=A0A3S9NXP9_9BACT|nr:insulinase family protein [Flammeovirga pectinis]AZQ60687.1 insulinase family protein [Flammeovirga pectinis]
MNQILDRKIAPNSYPVQDFSVLKPSILELENSSKVFILKNSSQPIIHFTLSIKGGKLVEKSLGSASLTSKMLGEGLKGMDSAQIHQKLEAFGAIISVSSDIDSFTINGHCLTRYFGEVVAMVKRYLTESEFSEKEFQHILQVMIQQKKLSEEKTSFIATKLFRENFYGTSHPYGQSLTSEELLDYDIGVVENYYLKNILHSPFDLFIAGDISDREIDTIKEVLGAIKFNRSSAILEYPPFVNKIATSSLKIYEDKDDAVQTSIRIGCPTFSLPNSDLEAFSVMNETLGDILGQD